MTVKSNLFGRIPGLDGLRAIAVILIFTRHVTINYFAYLFATNDSVIGEAGVILFFVLSGFLITKVILGNNNKPLKEKVVRFYSRRFLRIAPPLLIFLFIGIVTKSTYISDLWPWHVSFTTNIYIAINSTWIDEASHLWSLDVDEQFYLIWPMIFWTVKNKENQIYIILSFILFGIFSEIFMLSYLKSEFFDYTLPFRYAFPLASGATLAYIYTYYKDIFLKINHSDKFVIPCLFFTLSSLVVINLTPYNQASIILSNMIVTICILSIIWSCIVNKNSILVRFLEFPILKWIGLISYGIYIYHPIVVQILQFTRFSYALPHSFYGYIVYCVVTLVMASTSYYLVERPIMKLKRYV